MVETNQQLIETCAHMDKIMTHPSQPISTPSPDQVQECPDQVQEFHQLPQVDFISNHEITQPTLEETFENLRQFS